MAEASNAVQVQAIIQETRSAVKKISAEADRLKKFSEWQSLRENPVNVSVDKCELLESTRKDHSRDPCFGDLRDLLALLNLLACSGF